MVETELNAFRDSDRQIEIRDFIAVCSSGLALPLFLLFWLSDLIYVPDRAGEFLLVRVSIIPVCLITNHLMKHRVRTLQAAQLVGLGFVACNSISITYLVFRSGGTESLYYAGLNLVGFGVITFVPWSRAFLFATVITTYLPFYVGALWLRPEGKRATLVVESFFIVATIIISAVVRQFTEHLRRKELGAQLQLERELRSREQIIKEKTEEAVRLRALTRQFSPQIIAGIEAGRINLVKSIHGAEICAIFIDIVNSTDHVRAMEMEHVNEVMSMFMEDTMKVLLKHDLTIDKFLGDGVLAFSNDPVARPDFVERAIDAAIEVRARIRRRSPGYARYWGEELQIRIGVATGRASVGFYGSDEYLKAYTALGEVMNLASRLCSTAQVGQIAISEAIADRIATRYSVRPIGAQTLKGFAPGVLVYEIADEGDAGDASDIDVCPRGHGVLHLDTDERGIHVLVCRTCRYTLDRVAAGSGA